MPWQPRLAALCLLAALGGTDATAAMEDPGSVAGNFLAGNSALEAGDLTAAANYLDLALEEEPDDVELRRQVFTVQLAAGHYDLALATARELIKLDPVDFAYSYMTRTGRVDHEEVKRRDPALAAAYEARHKASKTAYGRRPSAFS